MRCNSPATNKARRDGSFGETRRVADTPPWDCSRRPRTMMWRVSSRTLAVVALLAAACLAPGSAAAQDSARGTWHAAGDCFIRSFILGDRGTVLVTFSDRTSDRAARWVWREEGLTIVSNRRGVLLMNGHYEDATLVAEVDYSTTDDIDFRTCRFSR